LKDVYKDTYNEDVTFYRNGSDFSGNIFP